MPIAIGALETYGWQEAFSDISVMESLVQNDDTVSWIVAEIIRPGDSSDQYWAEYVLDLSWVLARADANLLKRRRKDVFGVRLLNADVREIIGERTRLLTVDKDSCWQNLEDFCARVSSQQRDADLSIDTAFHLVEAISRNSDKYSDRVLSILSQPADLVTDTAAAWMRLFMIRLAGQIRLTGGIPHIVAKLQRRTQIGFRTSAWLLSQTLAMMTSSRLSGMHVSLARPAFAVTPRG